MYIVLGILYENYIHPITILSTLPSAGVGALLAILVTHSELDIIALIGILLLIGIVKKNAILMIDFAIQAERNETGSPEEAIYEACLLRFRPIMMTTMAALFGGLPIALSTGNGSELRRPLGIAIVGGLIVSQMLTLYTTPVVYLYMDRFRAWVSGGKKLARLDKLPSVARGNRACDNHPSIAPVKRADLLAGNPGSHTTISRRMTGAACLPLFSSVAPLHGLNCVATQQP